MSGLPSVAVGGIVASAANWMPERDDPNREFTYIDLTAVDQDAKAITGARKLPCAEAPSRARQMVSAGDVIVSTVRPNLNAVARVPPELDGATASTGFCVLRPRPDRLDSNYLFHWARSPRFVGEMVRRAAGASYPAVTDRIVYESRLSLPPLPEQRRIAEILDKADALRAKRCAGLAQLDALTQSIFLDMFGDPATNPKGWPRKTIGDLATKISDGPFGSNLKSEHYTDAGVRVIRLQSIDVGEFLDSDKAYISEQHFASLEKHECLPGDVLIGTLGDPNLRACVQPNWLARALNKAACVQLRPDESIANAAYLCAILNCLSTERMAQGLVLGQTQLRISMGRLRTLEVPVPPIDLQCTFAQRMMSVQVAKVALQRSLGQLESLFSSLQHRAFRGEL
jgi:type I restriction enzyme S subunit